MNIRNKDALNGSQFWCCSIPPMSDIVVCSGSKFDCPGKNWYHFTCVGLTVEEIKKFTQTDALYLCPSCDVVSFSSILCSFPRD